MFVVFLATWLIARHGIYVFLCWSIYRDVPRVMPFACHASATGVTETDAEKLNSKWRYAEPFLNQKGTICLDRNVKWVFLGLLLMLQVLSVVWFGMIIKVALKLIQGRSANDTRSSDEDEDEEDMVKEVVEQAENIANCKSLLPSSTKVRSSGSEVILPRQTGLFQGGAGRIRVPGSRDRKELIGRVGCNG